MVRVGLIIESLWVWVLFRQGLSVGGVNVQRSLHLQYHDGVLEQGTDPPTAPQAPQHKWLPTAPSVCSRCVCVFTAVCVCTWMGKCRARIPSMGHHGCMSLSLHKYRKHYHCIFEGEILAFTAAVFKSKLNRIFLQENVLTSTVCQVPIFTQGFLITSISPNGRPGVRVLVDQALNTFPTAKSKDNSPKYISISTITHTKSFDLLCWSG